MTLDEFFVALEETRDMGWSVNERGVLRARESELVRYCPITAVAMHKLGMFFYPEKYSDAAEALGITLEDAADVANCADWQETSSELPEFYAHLPAMKKRLLVAVGLS